MNHLKKVFVLLLSLAILIPCISLNAFAAGNADTAFVVDNGDPANIQSVSVGQVLSTTPTVVSGSDYWGYSTERYTGTFYPLNGVLIQSGYNLDYVHGLWCLDNHAEGSTFPISGYEFYVFNQSEVFKQGSQIGTDGTYGLMIKRNGYTEVTVINNISKISCINDHIYEHPDNIYAQHTCTFCKQEEPYITIPYTYDKVYACQYTPNSWYQDKFGYWYYIKADGSFASDWLLLGNTWYYFDPYDNQMQVGPAEINGSYYLFKSSGAMAANGWAVYEGKWYYASGSGRLYTGWIRRTYDGGGGDWFYAEANGALVEGWKQINGTWYYFENNNYGYNYMYHFGPVEINGKDYFFYENGAMATGWIKRSYDNGNYVEWYYADSSGALQKGWQKIGNSWYYFEENENWGPYRMYKDQTATINGKQYYFTESGAMGTGWCKQVHNYGNGEIWTNWFYANGSGVLQTGWQKIGGVWYYFDEYGYMATGAQLINNKWYVFQSNGAWTTKAGWLSVTNGKYTNWYYLKSDGTPTTGWKKIGNTWYYFNKHGVMASNTTENINGKVYAFEKSGALVSTSGWKKITSEYNSSYSYWVYTYKDGTAATEWLYVGGAWYYLSPIDGRMISDNYILDGKLNLFNSNGVWTKVCDQVGWYKAEGSWVYVESTDGTVATGWLELEGKKYYLGDYGYMVSGQYWTSDEEGNSVCYYFANSGELLTGWITTDWGETFYADENGILQTGPRTIDGNLYYFDENNYYMYRMQRAYVDEVEYYFDENGIGTPANQGENY